MGASQRGHRAGGARRGGKGRRGGAGGDGPQVGPTPAPGLAPAAGRGADHGERPGRAEEPPVGPLQVPGGCGGARHDKKKKNKNSPWQEIKGRGRDGAGERSGAIRNKGARR